MLVGNNIDKVAWVHLTQGFQNLFWKSNSWRFVGCSLAEPSKIAFTVGCFGYFFSD